jgi:hypothetical protein
MTLQTTDEATNNIPAPAVKHRYNTVARMSQVEMMEISFHLQKHHAIFNKFFTSGAPIFERTLHTAAVYATADTGKFLFMKINPDFWASLDMTQKLFIISHECLHLILNHLTRLCNEKFPRLVNYAKDLVVNHMAVEKFGFKRSEIDPENVYCWVDKFFKSEENIKTNETAEYYYSLLLVKKENGTLPEGCETVDEHATISPEDLNDFIDDMDKFLTPEEKEYLKDILIQHGAVGGGTIAGKGGGPGSWTFFDIKVKKKKKWETVIKRWAMQTAGRKEKVADQWARINRRFAFLSDDLFLPSELETDEAHKEKKKIDVMFFLDTSGSCHHLAERFFIAAKSLPSERFNIRLFCFHDYVVETDISGDKVHKGGGTNFQIIENEIQKTVSAGGKYPKAVFVVTDGDGTPISAEYPENYHWFLSHRSISYIPKESKWYDLNDFE